jgi:putative intracellular protease/amidase
MAQPEETLSVPRVLVPLPDVDFDTTEVVVPWKRFRDEGFDVVFATEKGKVAQCDPRLLTGPFFGKLGALPSNVALYRELEKDPAFLKPITYDSIVVEDYAALLLPGGHAPGMKQYLESDVLRQKVLRFMRLEKPIGAICHGPLVLARTIDPETKKSVLFGRRVAGLPKFMEMGVYFLTKWKLGGYYRTYPAYVQDEVSAAIQNPAMFDSGPLMASYAKPFYVRDQPGYRALAGRRHGVCESARRAHQGARSEARGRYELLIP